MTTIEIKPIRKKISDFFRRKKKFEVQEDLYLSDAEKHAFKALRKIKIEEKNVRIFYPGSGNDVLRPTMLLKTLTDFRKARIILADTNVNSDIAAQYFSTITNCRKFKKQQDKYTFFFKDKTIHIECHNTNVLYALPEMDKIHIYFERAFQVFRQASPEYFLAIKTKLAKGAIVISDYGDITGMEQLEVPEEAKSIGFYKNLSVYRFNGF